MRPDAKGTAVTKQVIWGVKSSQPCAESPSRRKRRKKKRWKKKVDVGLGRAKQPTLYGDDAAGWRHHTRLILSHGSLLWQRRKVLWRETEGNASNAKKTLHQVGRAVASRLTDNERLGFAVRGRTQSAQVRGQTWLHDWSNGNSWQLVRHDEHATGGS